MTMGSGSGSNHGAPPAPSTTWPGGTVADLRREEMVRRTMGADKEAIQQVLGNASVLSSFASLRDEREMDDLEFREYAQNAGRVDGKSFEKAINMQKRENERRHKMESHCYLCSPVHLSKGRCDRGPVIAWGLKTYLRIPDRGKLSPFHCQIVPHEHLPSFAIADPDVQIEVARFKSCIARMMRIRHLPLSWAEQRHRLGFAD